MFLWIHDVGLSAVNAYRGQVSKPSSETASESHQARGNRDATRGCVYKLGTPGAAGKPDSDIKPTADARRTKVWVA